MNEDFVLGTDGQYRNKYGSIVYPQITAAKRGGLAKYHRTKPKKKPVIKKELIIPKIYKKNCYQEFEIQAVAYCTLRDYFNDEHSVAGEYTLGKGTNRGYYRCDIAIFKKNSTELLAIIEVKRNEREVSLSKGQIEQYYQFCPNVIVVSSMQEAENIIEKIEKLLI